MTGRGRRRTRVSGRQIDRERERGEKKERGERGMSEAKRNRERERQVWKEV